MFTSMTLVFGTERYLKQKLKTSIYQKHAQQRIPMIPSPPAAHTTGPTVLLTQQITLQQKIPLQMQRGVIVSLR